MVPLNRLDADSIISDEIFQEVFDQEDEIYRARLILSLEERAEQLGRKKQFAEMLKAYKKVDRDLKRMEREKEKKKQVSLLENWTNFSDSPYLQMQCRNWIASDDGVFISNPNPGAPDILACYHPILPVERLVNLETGKEQIRLAFKRNGRWKELVIPKGIITSNAKIVALSELGVAVTSENARYLVKFLADIENANEDEIAVKSSSGKLGWIGTGFIPYDTEIAFDGDLRFRSLFQSVTQHGSREVWYNFIKELRKIGRKEFKFMLAASFASILIEKIGALPFWVDLYGETGGGKTISLMIAGSVWGNPRNNNFIIGFNNTDVNLEVRADMLNNLPMILDDTSQGKDNLKDKFEKMVYDLTSGKGKGRSNKDLGIARETHWNLIILCNGEHPLQGYVNQAGAFNRIIEIESNLDIYSDPKRTLSIINENYGFAGLDFVNVIKTMGKEELIRIQQDFQKQLESEDKMQKQAISVSIILTADKLIRDYLFHDDCSITIEEAKEAMTDKAIVSENERCYWYLVDKVMMNEQRFDGDTKCEKWGLIEPSCAEHTYTLAILHNTAFKKLCEEGNYSPSSFLKWASKHDLIEKGKDSPLKQKKIDGKNGRCVFLKIYESEDEYNKQMRKMSENNTDKYDIVFD